MAGSCLSAHGSIHAKAAIAVSTRSDRRVSAGAQSMRLAGDLNEPFRCRQPRSDVTEHQACSPPQRGRKKNLCEFCTRAIGILEDTFMGCPLIKTTTQSLLKLSKPWRNIIQTC